ncbi:MAG: peptidylprolyl isomerase, partial [Candidatus Omnitrophota bacterium]
MKNIAAIFLSLLFLTNAYGKDAGMEGKNVVLETNQGVIEIKLFPEFAPKTCEHFTKLGERGSY